MINNSCAQIRFGWEIVVYGRVFNVQFFGNIRITKCIIAF